MYCVDIYIYILHWACKLHCRVTPHQASPLPLLRAVLNRHTFGRSVTPALSSHNLDPRQATVSLFPSSDLMCQA